jgi:hypothetical protein
MVPMAEDPRAYSHPSVANEPTRPARLSPTARIMPSSVFRSWANITKMLTSRRIPASTLKKPMLLNSSVNWSPLVLADSSRSCLAGSTVAATPVNAPSRVALTSFVRAAPSITFPGLETRTALMGGLTAVAAWGALARSLSMVPGATNRLGDSLLCAPPSPAMPSPAIPSRGSSFTTVNSELEP